MTQGIGQGCICKKVKAKKRLIDLRENISDLESGGE